MLFHYQKSWHVYKVGHGQSFWVKVKVNEDIQEQ